MPTSQHEPLCASFGVGVASLASLASHFPAQSNFKQWCLLVIGGGKRLARLARVANALPHNQTGAWAHSRMRVVSHFPDDALLSSGRAQAVHRSHGSFPGPRRMRQQIELPEPPLMETAS